MREKQFVVLAVLFAVFVAFNGFLLMWLLATTGKLATATAQINGTLSDIKGQLSELPFLPGMGGGGPGGPGGSGSGGHGGSSSGGPGPGSSGEPPGGTSGQKLVSARVLAQLIVLQYEARTTLTDAQSNQIKQVLRGFKSHPGNIAAMQEKVWKILDASQRSYLKGTAARQVESKTEELSGMGQNDAAFVDLAIQYLDSAIHPDAPGSSSTREPAG